MFQSIFPCLVVSLPLRFAVMLSAVACIGGARPHLRILSIPALFSFWKWGLFPSPQESLQTLLGCQGHWLPSSWLSSDLLLPSPHLQTTPSFNFYSLHSVLAEVALSYWPHHLVLNKHKKDGKYFKWSGPKLDPQVNSAKVSLHDCRKGSCSCRSLERPGPWPILNTQSLIHGRNLIMDIHFFEELLSSG